MARREAVLTAAYVALALAASYALDALLTEDNVSIHEQGGEWLVGYLALGLAASVALGVVARSGWALAAPFVVPFLTIPAGDVFFELPLVVLTAVLAPLATAAIGFGRALAGFARRANVENAVSAGALLLLLALPIGVAVAMGGGYSPWEDETPPTGTHFAVGVACAAVGGGACLALAALAGRLGRRRP